MDYRTHEDARTWTEVMILDAAKVILFLTIGNFIGGVLGAEVAWVNQLLAVDVFMLLMLWALSEFMFGGGDSRE